MTTLTSMIENLALTLNRTGSAVDRAKEKHTGTYTTAVALGVAADSWESLAADFAVVENRIRRDGRFAVRVGAKKRAKPTKDGDIYTVPSALMAVKSVLKDAFAFGIALTEDGSQRAYTAIKKDAAKAKAEAKAETLSGDDLVRCELAGHLDAIKALLGDLHTGDLDGLYNAVATLADSAERMAKASTAEAETADVADVA